VAAESHSSGEGVFPAIVVSHGMARENFEVPGDVPGVDSLGSGGGLPGDRESNAAVEAGNPGGESGPPEWWGLRSCTGCGAG